MPTQYCISINIVKANNYMYINVCFLQRVEYKKGINGVTTPNNKNNSICYSYLFLRKNSSNFPLVSDKTSNFPDLTQPLKFSNIINAQ